MNERLAPLQSQQDAINQEAKEAGCSYATGEPISMSEIIGSKAQECKMFMAQEEVIIAQMKGITDEYAIKLGVTPTSEFTTQQSVSGQHYEFYYNGYGSGTIYNTENPTESYNIYCAYDKCDIYGN